MGSYSTSELTGALARAVDDNWDRQVRWLQHLVRYQSLRGHEADCQNWLADEFNTRGWKVDRYNLAQVGLQKEEGFSPLVGVDPSELWQVVARIDGGREPECAQARSLILQGHVDVVPPGPREMWDRDPFCGDIVGDWLYGRGAQDMKMGISALVFALDALSTATLRPAGPVFLQTVTEEESTGNGALSTLVRGYRADACLIPEPTANTLIRAQCGAVWFRISLRDAPVHVEAMAPEENVISAAFTVIKSLQELSERMNAEARAHPLFAQVAKPIKFNPGIIQGGDWPSSTPGWCQVDCRLGLLPGESVAHVQSQITETISAAVRSSARLTRNPPKISWNGFQAAGSVLPVGSAAEKVLADSHREVFETSLTSALSNAVNDTRYYNGSFQIPGLCYGPSGEGLHGVNERANLPNLKKTTLVIALFVANWCGVKSL